MEPVLGRFVGPIYSILRLVAGLLFACHGAQKLFGALGGHAVPIASQMGLAGIIEFGGGLLIAVGLFTSPVALIASGEMAWAYFQAHAPRATFPIQNGGELAALYSFLWLYVAARGAGPLSLDKILRRKG
jgi:putative oxidoreductase